MPEKFDINRRDFLRSTSAAAIGSVVRGGEAATAGPQAFRSPAGSLIPYARTEIFPKPSAARVFSGAELAQIAFPLGGIGSGTVSLGGRGQLCDWAIFNRPGFGRVLPFSFVSLWVRAEGEKSGTIKVVEAPLMPPFTGSFGYSRESAQGLPRLRGARFTGEYPFAKIVFEDETLPVEISLEAFNPFIPLNVDDSSLPVAVFRYSVRSVAKGPVDLSLAFSLLNAVGYDGKGAFSDNRYPSLGKNATRFRSEKLSSGTTLNGLDMSSSKYSPGDVNYGSLALLTDAAQVTALTSWEGGASWDDGGAGWDSFQEWYNLFSRTGGFHDPSALEQEEAQLSPDGRSNYATLAPRLRLLPGEVKPITFFLAWNFPVRENYWNDEKEVAGQKLKNYYGTRFYSAWSCGRYTAQRLPELESKTRAFQKSFFASTVPSYVLEAVSSQAAILRTNTCMILEGKQFFAFEGCGDASGCCPMNCAHVWNYEQALAFLFPELERSMRHTDFTYNMREDGSMTFRTLVPVGRAQWSFPPAADGQMGCIMKLYREWQLSGDDEFMKQLWPQAKLALEYAWTGWDENRDGIMEGEQENTYDFSFFGPNSMMSTLYLGALRAGELMASAAGDDAAAQSYREVRLRGVKNLEQLWNGEYYFQKVTPVDQIRPLKNFGGKDWYRKTVVNGEIRYQCGPGCLSDQLLGEWFARVIGLDVGWSAAHARDSLRSIYRYNFRHEFYDHPNVQRIYALNGEKGLVLCSWPKGGRPTLPFVYSDEVWTGIEFQVAAHMIYEGLTEEGLSIVKGICDRYDGVRRNPWNEVECGSNYARALASWSVLLALSGFGCSVKERRLGFMPVLGSGNFQCFFCAGSGWGSYAQQKGKGASSHRLEVQHGSVPLRTLHLKNEFGTAAVSVSARMEPDGRTFAACKVKSLGDTLEVDFGEDVAIDEGKSVTLHLSA